MFKSIMKVLNYVIEAIKSLISSPKPKEPVVVVSKAESLDNLEKSYKIRDQALDAVNSVKVQKLTGQTCNPYLASACHYNLFAAKAAAKIKEEQYNNARRCGI